MKGVISVIDLTTAKSFEYYSYHVLIAFIIISWMGLDCHEKSNEITTVRGLEWMADGRFK